MDPDNYTVTASTGYPICIPSTFARTYDLDLDRSGGGLDPGESGLIAQDNGSGTSDELCPPGNRGTNPVADSRLFAPIQVNDHVVADGNFENIGGVTFLAHTVGVSVGLTTDDDPFQPDYMIFDEVGWDVPGFRTSVCATCSSHSARWVRPTSTSSGCTMSRPLMMSTNWLSPPRPVVNRSVPEPAAT